MDMNKIQSLLSDNFQPDDDELNDEDLENELEAFLAGKSVAKPAVPVVRQGKPVAPRRKAEQPPRRPAPRPIPQASKNSHKNIGNSDPDAFDLSNIEKMMNNFDANNGSDDDIDMNDESLLSELNNYVSDSEDHHSGKEREPSQSSSNVSPQISKDMNSSNPRPSKSPKLDEPPSQPLIELAPSIALPEAKIEIDDKSKKIARVKQLQLEYKRSALKAKTDGDKDVALSHFRITKQLDTMLNELNSGNDVDLSTLPPMPQKVTDKPSLPTSSVTKTSNEAVEEFEAPEMNQEEASKIYNAPTAAGSVMEALEQRLAKFKSTHQEAVAANNTSKIRRLGRIVKTYETAIKDYKKGKPVNFEELPCPPGFPPIPTQSKPAAPAPPPKPSQPEAVPNQAATAKPTGGADPAKPGPSRTAPKPPLKRGMSIVASKQLKYLQERQRLFREAALEAKRRNELDQAKEYLRKAKGFDPLIEATINGLPIDATSIPTPPQLNNDDFVLINTDSVAHNSAESGPISPIKTAPATNYTDSEREDLFRKVEKELIDQIDMCNRNKEYFLKLGDIGTSSKFEKYSNESRKDLNMLVIRWRNGDSIPSYRTETRTFSIVVSNPEVGINEIYVDVVKAFDLPGKPEIDTYVKVEFRFPSDHAQFMKTKTVYNTLNPEYNESFKFEIDRKSRSLPRILKRHPLKLEIFSKGGFLRSDTLLGTVLVKLSDFETKCTIHEILPLTEGRKMINGRLEVKAKIREPLLAKQIEEIKEKWIVFP